MRNGFSFSFRKGILTGLLATILGLSGCANIHLTPNYQQAFKEQVLEGENAQAKVLLVDISGTLTDQPNRGLFGSSPSLMDRVLMQLRRAEKDEQIKAVLLKVNTPGGGVTVSDILYHELEAFKQRTGKTIYVQMMDVAASGGYYLALAADHIQAHPTTVTGSIGVISMNPDFSGTMDKLGVAVNVYKTGEQKDMGSPFRSASEQDQVVFQKLVDTFATRFYELVESRRSLGAEAMQEVKSARIFNGSEALSLGLIDSVGYLSTADEQACKLAGQKDCQVVTYSFAPNKNATLYTPSQKSAAGLPNLSQDAMSRIGQYLDIQPGLHYLYLQ